MCNKASRVLIIIAFLFLCFIDEKSAGIYFGYHVYNCIFSNSTLGKLSSLFCMVHLL